MKYRILATSVLVLVVAFLQSTICEYIEFLSIRPNLFIVMLVIVALLRNPVESAVMGVLLGLSFDILMGKSLGWYGLLFFFFFFPISSVNEKIYREKFLVLFAFTFLSTLIIELMFYLIIFLFKDYGNLPYVFSRIVLPESIYNSILVLPLFGPISKAYTLIDSFDRRRNRLSA